MASKIAFVVMIVGAILVIGFSEKSTPLWLIGIICEIVGGGIGIKEGIKLKKSRKKEDNEETKDW